GRIPAQMYMPMVAFLAGMGGLTFNTGSIVSVLSVLNREGLVGDEWGAGGPIALKPLAQTYEFPDRQGILFTPSLLGLDLAIRADGPGEGSASRFLYLSGW